jgi:hypothetical protein
VGWKDDVGELLNRLPTRFTTADIYRFVPVLLAKHPSNSNIEAKIRQQLQILRKEGEVRFLGDGSYERMQPTPVVNELPLQPGTELTRSDLSRLLGQAGDAPLRRGMFKPAQGAFQNHMFLFHNEVANPYGDVHDSEIVRYIGQGMEGNQELKGFNRTLANHLDDGVQVHYFIQPRDKPGIIRYQGQVFVEDYDEVFRPSEGRSVWEFTLLPAKDNSSSLMSEYGKGLDEAILYDRPAGPVEHPIITSLISRKLRDRAFQKRVLSAYRNRCAICGNPLIKGKLSELQGAHVQAVAAGGPHEVRNGMSLCVRHHWAFDHGFFTIGSGHTVEWLAPSPDPHEEAIDGAILMVPEEPHCPHSSYVEWHRRTWGLLA